MVLDMKIALCGRFHSDKRYQGGSAEVFLALARELSKKNTVTLFGRGKPTKEIVEMCNIHKIQYYWIPADSYLDILISPFRAFSLLCRKLDEEEIINAHSGCFSVASCFFKHKHKFIANIHEVLSTKNRSFSEAIYGLMENMMNYIGAKHADLLIVNNFTIKNHFTSKGVKNIKIISNGIKNEFFLKPQRKNNKVIRLLYVGRLAKSKNISILIDTASKLGSLAELNIIGDGEMKKEIQLYIKRRNINNVYIRGIKVGTDLLEYYKKSDFFVMSSEYEGVPLVLLEAMASGLPIIASRVPGITELVGNKGILISSPTNIKFVSEIIQLSKNNNLRKKIISLGIDFAKNYSWAKISKLYETQFQSVLRKKEEIKFKRPTAVTISWDDGRKRDLKLAYLLKKYNLKGTFYVSPKNREWKKKELLSDKQIRNLSKYFEIGAHTMTHPVLSCLSEIEAYKEIKVCKEYLESITKKKINSFCYPRGVYNEKIKSLVKKAGFKSARTVARFHMTPNEDTFEFGTSVHTYNQKSDIFYILKFSNYNLVEIYRNLDWEHLAKRLFDYVKINGGVYHLWGHTWEMDKYNDWDKLERVLAYISYRKNVKYLTNSEVVSTMKGTDEK